MIYYHSSECMPELEDESVQLVITSPPYPMIQKWDEVFHLQKEGVDLPIDKTCFIWMNDILNYTWKECYRVLIDGGIACINIGDATRTTNNEFICYPNYAQLSMSMWELGFSPLIPILWKKISNRPNAFLGSGFQPVNAYISQDCEFIGIFRKGKIRTFVGEEKERRKKSTFTKEERDVWFQQIWTGIPGAKGSKKSSSWNPEIPTRLVRMFSIVGDTILDPFCGRVGGPVFENICSELQRHFIGYTL